MFLKIVKKGVTQIISVIGKNQENSKISNFFFIEIEKESKPYIMN